MTAKEELIADLKAVSDCTEVAITRDFYRAHGAFSDKVVTKHFSTFEAFCQAAGVNQPAETSEIDGDKWSVFIPSTEFCSVTDIVRYCKVDTKVWEVDRFRAKDVSKEDGARFQISAFFKKRKDMLAIQSEIEALKNLAKAEIQKRPAKASPEHLTGLLLEIAIPDLHIGKLAWPVETGGEPYDVHIAEAVFERALNILLERSSSHKFEEVLFTVGNDLLNSDNAEGTTTKGTAVTTDIRYHKTFWKARNLMIRAIERLRQIAPVRVLVCPGNHDSLAAFHLGDSLECYYHNDKDVIVMNNPCPRKYVEWGKTMLMFCHGDLGERNDYALLMATEMPEMFGRTKFREVHTGHLHKTKVDEQHGIRVRILPSLTAADDWHSNNGYVGNLRNAEAFFWSKEQGLVGMAIYNNDCQPPIITKRAIV